MELENIKIIINKVLNEFYERDSVLVDYNSCSKLICERTISARLAMYLQNAFKEYEVDCEYNKHINDIKTIDNKKIFPDIVIHKRKNDEDNLIWIELKKYNSYKKSIDNDRERLTIVTKENFDFKYQYGVLIIINQNIDDCIIEYYKDGKLIK